MLLLLALLLLNSVSSFVPLVDWSNNIGCSSTRIILASNNRNSNNNPSTNSNNGQSVAGDRRDLFRSAFGAASIIISSATILPRVALALAGEAPTKPFASNEALLPALRIKLTIDRAIQLVNQIPSVNNVAILKEGQSPTTANQQQQGLPKNRDTVAIVQELQSLLLLPQNYVGSLKLQGVPTSPAKPYLESYRSMAGDLPLQSYLVQNGDVRAWKALKRTEKEQEKTNEIRAALNAYTDVLNFSGDSYQLNVDKQTKSSMVREDRLPQLKQVITSDMGLRYLYRNQIITAMDDVRAEMEYQVQVSQPQQKGRENKDVVTPVFDGRDLLELLTEAQRACDQWFSLIDPKDVQLALDTVQSEKGM